ELQPHPGPPLAILEAPLLGRAEQVRAEVEPLDVAVADDRAPDQDLGPGPQARNERLERVLLAAGVAADPQLVLDVPLGRDDAQGDVVGDRDVDRAPQRDGAEPVARVEQLAREVEPGVPEERAVADRLALPDLL